MNELTLSWWSLLCLVSGINVLAWISSTWLLRHRSGLAAMGAWSASHWHVILSAGYVLGCAYRSVFPVYDVQRIVIVDSWLSSVIVGRSVATFAELCFAAQWALLLRTMAQTTGNQLTLRVSRCIVPLIVVAEICSWYAVLTTSNLGHVLEETLWGFSACILVASFLYLWPRSDRAHRPFLALFCAAGLAYAAYMFLIDVPMYWARWMFDEGRGYQYLSVVQGFSDVSERWVVSHRWDDWQSEVVWMTLYFSVAVWLSIGLMHVSHTLHKPENATLPEPVVANIGKPRWFKNPYLP